MGRTAASAFLQRHWGQNKRRLKSVKIVVAVGIVAITAVSFAHAATVTIKPLGSGMPPAVFIKGEIAQGDADRFRSMTASLPQAIVTLSPGGTAADGILISGIIREKGYTTYVASDAVCASACSIAWLGGTKRAMSINAQIGFHAVYNSLSGQDSGQPNALLGVFLTQELGLPVAAVAYVTKESGPDHLEWLNLDDARRVGIAVTLFESNGAPVTPAAFAALMPSGAVEPYTLPAQVPKPASTPEPPAAPTPGAPTSESTAALALGRQPLHNALRKRSPPTRSIPSRRQRRLVPLHSNRSRPLRKLCSH